MSNPDLPAARARLLAQVEEAARVIAPLWPLATFVAVNPLWDLRHLSFDDAIANAARVLDIDGYPSEILFAQAYADRRITDADLRAALGELSAITADSPRRLRGGDCEQENPENTAGARDGTCKESCSSGKVMTPTERHDYVFDSALAASVDREVAKWCGAYLASILPERGTGGFYAAWRSMVVRDPSARGLVGKAGRDRLGGYGSQPEDAILTCLDLLDITEEERVAQIARQFARMPGWAGHAKWRSRWASAASNGPALHMLDYLAVRYCYEAELLRAARTCKSKRYRLRGLALASRSGLRDKRPERGKPRQGRKEWFDVVDVPDDLREDLSSLSSTEAARATLSAYETNYRDQLLAALDRPAAGPPARSEACFQAQAVFCIDARSEGLRRHLERAGPYETFGFAGFFALPIRYRAFGSTELVDLCPVLIRPNSELDEMPSAGAELAASRQLAGAQGLSAASGALRAARKGAVSPFILAEATGFFAGPIAAAKTLAPARFEAVRRWILRMLAPSAPTVIAVDLGDKAMSDEEQALFSEAALVAMGLTRNFAPVVLLCGHGSTTENNPYGSSLDCGACGGNTGGTSARAAAAIFNRPIVRRLLADRGICIPESTFFVAGEHDTTTDKVMIFDPHLLPPARRGTVRELEVALRYAGNALAAERVSHLSGARHTDPVAQVVARSADWAQVQPEWGLARNAAFIVAPRDVTAGVNLSGRCFLHSYDADLDPSGTALEMILTAPMIVAHWISAQYYFSSVDPEVFSSGDKTVHNIVAGIGVIQGAGGDLKVGLPLQSLFDAGLCYHEPMRLLTIVQAPQPLLDAVIARNQILRELFDGRWVHLVARDHGCDAWKVRDPHGAWTNWTPAWSKAKEPITCG